MNEPYGKTCFVISPIGKSESDERKRADLVLRHIISPAVASHGYNILRADKISKPSIITTDILEYLLNAELVIADLTNHNPNVFYELAVRHVYRKPVISIIEDGQAIPFDIAQSRIILFNEQDLDSVENCKLEIQRQIEAIHSDSYEMFNPISSTVDLIKLRESGDPLQRSTAEIVSVLHEINAKVDRLEVANGVRNYHYLNESVISFSIRDALQSPEDKIKERENARLYTARRVVLWVCLDNIDKRYSKALKEVDDFFNIVREKFANVELTQLTNPSVTDLQQSPDLEVADIILAVVLDDDIKIIRHVALSKSWVRRKLYVLLPMRDARSPINSDMVNDVLVPDHLFYFHADSDREELFDILKDLLYAALVTEYRKG
jgi:hypothetical protein